MAGNITIDIQAKVVGYEQSIKTLQAALAKVNPGSDIGKNIVKAMQQAQQQVQALARNMFPKASSDTQIDSIIEKVNRAGEAIQNVSHLMQGLTLGDLNLGSLSPEISRMITEVNKLQSALDTALNTGIQEAVTNSQALTQAFDSLGIKANKITAEGGLQALTNGLLEAQEKAEEAAKATAEVQQKFDSLQESINNLKSSPMAKDSFSIDSLIGDFDKLKDVGRTFDLTKLQSLKQQMLDVLKTTKMDDNAGAKAMIESIMGSINTDTTVDQFKDKIREIRDRLQAEFGLSANKTNKVLTTTGTGEKLFESLFGIDEKSLEAAKARFRTLFEEFGKGLTPAQQARVLRLVDENNLNAAVRVAQNEIRKAYAQLKQTMADQQKELGQVSGALTTAQTTEAVAKTNESAFSTALQEYKNRVEEVERKNETLSKEVEILREQIRSSGIDALNRIKGAGASSGVGARENMFPTNAASLYRTELEKVRAAEQMVGKVQGVVQRWFSIYTVVRSVSNAIKSIISTIKELDKTITEIAIVTNMDQNQLWGQMPQYTAMAREYAASISGVYQVSQLYYQQGLQTADVMALTEQTLKMARISGLDYAQATDYMTNAIRSFKMEMTDAQSVVDVYSAVAASSATNVTELASAMSKTASSAQAVGSSFESTTAMMAVMIEATRESAENIGSAMKSIISRYGEMTSDPSKLVDSEGEEMSLNRVDKALQTVGISIHNAVGEFRNFDEVIMELAGKWDTIDTNTQRYIATIMAGNRQQSRFLALVSSGERLKELSAEAADSEDASQLQFLKTLDSVDAKVQQLKTSLQSLYIDTGLEKSYKGILDWLNNIIVTLTGLPTVLGLPLPAITKIGTTFASVANIVTTVFGLMKLKISANIKALSNETIAQEETTAAQAVNTTRQEVNQKINEYERYYNYRGKHETLLREQETSGAAARVKGGISKTSATVGILANMAGLIVSSIADNMDEKTQWNRNTKAWLAGGSNVLQGIGLGASLGGVKGAVIGGALGAVKGAIEALGIAVESTEEKINNLSTAITETSNAKIKSKDTLTTLTEYKAKYDELSKAQYQSAEDKKAFIDLQNEIAATYPELIKSMTVEGNYVIDMANGYKELATAKANAYKKDYLSNLTAELNGLNDLDYVLEKVYGQEPIKTQNSTLNNIANFLGANIGTDTANAILKKDLDGLTFDQLTLSTLFNANKLSSGTKEKSIGIWPSVVKPVMNAFGVSKGFTATAEGALKYLQIISKAKSAAEIDTTQSDIITDLVAQFPEFSKEIEYFISHYYDSLVAATHAVKYQEELIDNRMNTAMNEWISVLGEITGKKSTGFQGAVIADKLKDEWEIFQRDVEEGTRENAAGETILKVGSEIKDEDGTIRKKTLADLYAEFIEQYDYSWYRAIEDQTHYLQEDTIDQLYNDRGKYSKKGIRQQASFKLLDSDAQYEFLKLYDEAAKDNIELYNNFIREKFKDNTYAKKILSGLTGQIGFDFLPGITSQLSTILNNSSFSEETKDNLINNLSDIYNLASAIPDADKSAQLISKINTGDLNSLSGIYNIIDFITSLKLENGEEIKNKFKVLADKVIINLNTEISNYISNITNSISDFEKAISNASKGMDLKTAITMANKLGKTLTDFDFRDGKYYYEDLANIEDIYLPENDEYLTALNDYIDDISTFFKENPAGTDMNRILNKYGDNLQLIKQAIDDEIDLTGAKNIDKDTVKVFAAEYLDRSAEDINLSFSKWLEKHLQEVWKTNKIEIDNYRKDQKARTYLSNGNIKQFLSTVGVEYSTELEALIQSGDIQKLPQSLSDWFKTIYDTYGGIAKNVFDSVSKAEAGDVLFATNLNEFKFEELVSAGVLEKIADKAYKFVGDYFTLSAALIGENLDFKTKSSYLQAAWENAASIDKDLTDILTSGDIDFNVASQFVEYLGGDISNIEAIMEQYGFVLNGLTGKWKANSNTVAQLRAYIDSFKSSDISDIELESMNNLEQLVDQISVDLISAANKAISDVVSSYASVTTEQIEAFANSIGQDYSTVITTYFTSQNADGTRRFDLSSFYKDVVSGNVKLESSLADFITAYIGEQDKLLETVSSNLKLNISGTNKIADLDKFTKEYNELISNEVPASIDDLFTYSEDLQAYTLRDDKLREYLDAAEEVLRGIGLTEEAIENYIDSQVQNLLTANLDIKGFVTGSDTTGKTKNAQSLMRALTQWANITKDESFNLEEYMLTLLAGGEKAVELLTTIKGASNVSTEEVQAVYKGRVTRLQNLMNSVNVQVNDIISGDLLEIIESLSAYGFEVSERLPDGSAVVTAVGSMVDAYNKLYAQLRDSSGATATEINSAYAKVLTARDQGNIDAISALSNAMGMDYDALGTLLAEYGQEGFTLLEDVIRDANSGLEQLYNGKVRIVDFTKFASHMNWKVGGEAYTEAFSAYNDSLIELDRQAEKNIVNKLNSITTAKAGDKINLTWLAKDLDEAIVNGVLRDYGAQLTNGILSISENANIIKITQAIAAMAAKTSDLLPEELAKLEDAIITYLSNITSLLSKGLSGTLTREEGRNLTEFARSQGIIETNDNLTFTQTAEGLRLANEQAFLFYDKIKQIDDIQGQITFDSISSSLQKTSDHYKDMASILERINELRSLKDTTDPTKRKQYEAELEIAERIAEIRASSEDSSFDFMNNKIPGGQQNPLKYASSWGKAWSVMRDSFNATETADKGLIDYENWYNIVNEMNNLAKIGSDIEFAGVKLDGSLEAASALIQKGIGSMRVATNGDLKVDIGSIGVDFSSGAEDLEKNVNAGIADLAHSQIAMLDSMISMLEVVVAMEKFGELDVDNDMKISIDELLAGDIIDGEPVGEGKLDEAGKYIERFGSKYKRLTEEIIAIFDNSDDEKKQAALDQVTANGHTMREIFTATEEQLKEWQIDADQLSKLITGFRLLAVDDNYDVDNPWESFIKIFGGMDFGDLVLGVNAGDHQIILNDEGSYSINIDSSAVQKRIENAVKQDKTVFTDPEKLSKEAKTALEEINAGKEINVEQNYALKVATGEIQITTDPVNKSEKAYKVGTRFYSNYKDAVAASDLIRIGASDTDQEEFTVENGKAKGTLKIGEVEFAVESDGNGQPKYMVDNTPYTDKKEAIKAYFKTTIEGQDLAEGTEEFDTAFKTWKLNMGIEVEPVIKITDKTKVTKDIQQQALQALKDEDLDKLKDATVKAGITLRPNFSFENATANELKEIEAAFGIESKTVNLTAEITANGEESIVKAIEDGEALVQTKFEVELTGKDADTIRNMFGSGYASSSIKPPVENEEQPKMENYQSSSGIKAPVTTIEADTEDSSITEFLEDAADGVSVFGDKVKQITDKIQAQEETLEKPWESQTPVGSTQYEPDFSKKPEAKWISPTTQEDIEKRYQESLAAQQDVSEVKYEPYKPVKTPTVSHVDTDTEEITAEELFGKSKARRSKPAVRNGIEYANEHEAELFSEQTEVSSAEFTMEGGNVKVENAEWAGDTKEQQDQKYRESLENQNNIPEVEYEPFVPVNNGLGASFIGVVGGSPQEASLGKAPKTETVKVDEPVTVPDIEVNGNVDLKLRPVVSPEAMQQAGYEFEDDYATLFSQTFTSAPEADVQVVLNATPITADGTVWTEEELTSYIEDFLLGDGTRSLDEILQLDAENAGMVIDIQELTGNLDEAIAIMTEKAEKLHEAQAKMYDKKAQEAGLTTEKTETEVEVEVTATGEDKDFVKDITDKETTFNTTVETNLKEEAENFESSAESAKSGIETANKTFSDAMDQLGTTAAGRAPEVNTLADAAVKIPDGKGAAIQSVADAINNLPDSKTIEVGVKVKVEASGGSVESQSPSADTTTSVTKAKGNIALASGTLMGELGPELVVSGGRYFVAGQNGAEFVDLDDDAIVFNHLQTQQLLKNGMSPSRGKALTSERNAIAFATGNVNGGPAMASASAALAALKELRAMWEKLTTISAKDLAGTGGSGGGGGGGGDNSSTSARNSWIAEVERWYNLMQKIAQLEKDITHEETLRTKLQSDFQKNGKAYYESQKRSLQSIEQQMIAQEQLNISRREYFNQRRTNLNEQNGPFTQLYGFNESGQLQYKNGAFDFLSDLMSVDDYGKPKYSAEEQYNLLVSKGFKDYMYYDSSGKEITDESAKSSKGTDSETSFYTSSVQAFWDLVESQKTEMQDLYDTIEDGENQLLELESDRNEILEAIRDNQMDVEKSILDAIVSSRQEAIDNLSDQRAALEESYSKYMEGLSNALSREREMYQNEQDEEELNKMRRQLAILRRSGGSASQISSLTDEIRSKEQDTYFNLQQQQIDKIQEASDLEIERLDTQINLMTETLEYEKEHGLLWGLVYDYMFNHSAFDIAEYIFQHDKDIWGESPLGAETSFQDALFKATQWEAFRTDQDTKYDALYNKTPDGQTISDAVYGSPGQSDWKIFNNAMTELYGDKWRSIADTYKGKFFNDYSNSGDITRATTNITSALNNMGNQLTSALGTAFSSYSSGGGSSGGSNGGVIGGSSGGDIQNKPTNNKGNISQTDKQVVTGVKQMFLNMGNTFNETGGKMQGAGSVNGGLVGLAQQGMGSIISNAGKALVNAAAKLPGYDIGGMVDADQIAVVHAKEAVLTPEQTRTLRNDILGNQPNSLMNLLLDFREAYSGIGSNSNITNDSGIIIENASVNMNISEISNDYDARRAGEQALSEMIRIARKTSAKNSIGR